MTLSSSPTRRDHGGADRSRVEIGAAVVGLCIGPLVAVISMAISRLAIRPGPLMIPLGLIAAVVYSAVFAGVMRRWGRMAGFAAVVGWLIGEVGSLLWNPGGDLLLAGDGFGYGFLLLCTGAVVVAASLDPRPTSSSSRRWWNRLRRHDR